MKKLVSPLDFVMVRFATKPYFFMRQAHINIDYWLNLRKIRYVTIRSDVYFELPEHLEIYTEVTQELSESLAPFAREIKRRLSVLSWAVIGKYRQPLTPVEWERLIGIGVPIIL